MWFAILPLAGVLFTTLGLVAAALIARRIGFSKPVWMLPLACLAGAIVLYPVGAQMIAVLLVAPTSVIFLFYLALAPWPQGATLRRAA